MSTMSDNSDSSVLTKFTRSSSADSTVKFHNMRKEYTRNSNKTELFVFLFGQNNGKTTDLWPIWGHVAWITRKICWAKYICMYVRWSKQKHAYNKIQYIHIAILINKIVIKTPLNKQHNRNLIRASRINRYNVTAYG